MQCTYSTFTCNLTNNRSHLDLLLNDVHICLQLDIESDITLISGKMYKLTNHPAQRTKLHQKHSPKLQIYSTISNTYLNTVCTLNDSYIDINSSVQTVTFKAKVFRAANLSEKHSSVSQNTLGCFTTESETSIPSLMKSVIRLH